MTSVKEHYDNLLAEHYLWMSGDYDAKIKENRVFFETTGIKPNSGGRALDLGCGPGYQSIVLAELGFTVLSIDLSDRLLSVLRGRSSDLEIETVQGDILDSSLYVHKRPFELAVCMGDTLTHLQAMDELVALFESVFESLEDGGRFIVTFRDLSVELAGVDRIVPIRSDESKIMVTFLEYEHDHVNVHDIIFVKGKSEWQLKKGVYKKLRIGADRVQHLLEKVGFEISSKRSEHNFSIIVARK
ncbi:MAG: class I SAM-dependent methyltransferase [Deltaproteobacteria bacterium]|nr:MAG: class I SAM-dependent methyltransferase [Deltaproteobacteria bacterium]